MKTIRNVYAIIDSKGKVRGLAMNPERVFGFKGWGVVKGQFVANKRQKAKV